MKPHPASNAPFDGPLTLRRDPVVFDPPYESPIEEYFAWEYEKVKDLGVSVQKQYRVETEFGRFRLDFVIHQADSRVGVECDGRHTHDMHRDSCRDSILLGEKHVRVVYRLRGSDLYAHPKECLHALALLEPSLFGARGLEQLRVATRWSSDKGSTQLGPGGAVVELTNDDDDGAGPTRGDEPAHSDVLREPQYVHVARHVADEDGLSFFKFALNRGRGDFDFLVDVFRHEQEIADVLAILKREVSIDEAEWLARRLLKATEARRQLLRAEAV